MPDQDLSFHRPLRFWFCGLSLFFHGALLAAFAAGPHRDRLPMLALTCVGIISSGWWIWSGRAEGLLLLGLADAWAAFYPGLPVPWPAAVLGWSALQAVTIANGERRFRLETLLASLGLGLGTLGWLLYRSHSMTEAILTVAWAAGGALQGLVLSQLHLAVAKRRRQVESLRLSAAQLAEANVRLQDYSATQEALAVAQERNRLAREIHDTLGHTLTSILVKLDYLDEMILQDPARAAGEVETIRRAAGEGLRDVRASVGTLRSTQQEEPVGREHWLRLTETFAKVTGVTVTAVIGEDFAWLPAEVDHAVYRAVQEGLTNSYRHGHAKKVLIEVWYEDGLLLLFISDNGRGLAGPAEAGAGFGLKGIQERVAALGGSVAWRSHPGRGFDLGMQIPCAGRERDGCDPGADRG